MAVITNNLPTSDVAPMTNAEFDVVELVTGQRYTAIKVLTQSAQEAHALLEQAARGVNRAENIDRLRGLSISR